MSVILWHISRWHSTASSKRLALAATVGFQRCMSARSWLRLTRSSWSLLFLLSTELSLSNSKRSLLVSLKIVTYDNCSLYSFSLSLPTAKIPNKSSTDFKCFCNVSEISTNHSRASTVIRTGSTCANGLFSFSFAAANSAEVRWTIFLNMTISSCILLPGGSTGAYSATKVCSFLLFSPAPRHSCSSIGAPCTVREDPYIPTGACFYCKYVKIVDKNTLHVCTKHISW